MFDVIKKNIFDFHCVQFSMYGLSLPSLAEKGDSGLKWTRTTDLTHNRRAL